MNDKKPHFWIPDEEVERVSKKPTGRTTPRDIVYSEHGAKLSHGLQLVKQAVEELKAIPHRKVGAILPEVI